MIINNWFECKVATEKTLESGATKTVTEPYLVDALNFTEAEARIIKEITPYCNGRLDVKDIRRVRYSELFMCDADDADKWFKVKCEFISLDEKTQAEKRTASLMLVQASDLHDAVRRFDEGMKGSMIDYEITTVQLTKILDVFPYEAATREKNEQPEYENHD
ncbi:MAG: DUF4494 domain-containing protein [Prevotellaceae bacterium]|nr:DUF4494 domain-containing protein [Prevotellaceae bacterium]